MIIVSSGSGTVTNINTALPLSGGPITTSGTITTSMATNKLIGRSTAGTGVMEEITVGTGLTLSGGTLSSSSGGAAGSTNEIQFNNAAAFAASANLRWIIADNRLVLGTENTADTNSRMVVIGKGISTQNTFVVHNQTGTNNALVVRDDGRVGIGTNTPTQLVHLLRNDVATRTQLLIVNTASSGTNNLGAGIRLVAGSGSTETIGEIYANPTNSGDTNAQTLNIICNKGINFIAASAFPSMTELRYRFVGTNMGMLLYERASGNRSEAMLYNENGSTSCQYSMLPGLSFTGWIRSSTTGFVAIGHGATTGTEMMRLVSATNNVLIGTTTDVASSILTLSSTTKGFLPPRMSTGDINNINSPATGLTVYNTTENTLCFYNGTSWQKVNHANL